MKNNKFQSPDRDCALCGKKTAYRICFTCHKELKKLIGIYADCYKCTSFERCQKHDPNSRKKCTVCNREDVCNVKRGGLCLYHFAVIWCELHPVSFKNIGEWKR